MQIKAFMPFWEIKMLFTDSGFKKKGLSGLTVLFVFIGILLVAAVFSSIYIKKTIDIKNQAGEMFTKIRNEESSGVHIIEIAGTDGLDGSLSDFTVLMKPLPGSSDLVFSNCFMKFSSDDKMAFLQYRPGGEIALSNRGYNTWTEQELDTVLVGEWQMLEEDLDDDAQDDYVTVNVSHALFNLSGTGGNLSVVQLNSTKADINLSAGNQTLGSYAEIEEESVVYGYLNVQGFNANKSLIDKSITFTVIPKRIYEGYYSVEYLSRGKLPVENAMVEGDIVMVHLQSFRDFRQDEFVYFTFVCSNIVPISKKVYTGATLPRQRKIVLFPQI